MKSKLQKRREAEERARSYTFENSKLYRKAILVGLPDEGIAAVRKQWEAQNEKAKHG
jgi:hypothetical protein